MLITKPYYRNCRQFEDDTYANSGKLAYVRDSRYAKAPEQYIRAFLLIQKDLKNLFDYIDTSDTNLNCYSFRTHELLVRACIEVEANCKAILLANGYTKLNKKDEEKLMNMSDYSKLEITHRLSFYEVKIPHWRGTQAVRTPFKNWSLCDHPSPKWYKAYNETKHNRHEGFEQANFENLIDAVSGLLILLSSQFYTVEFSSSDHCLIAEGSSDGMETAIGDYFKIKFSDYPKEEQYAFTYNDWKRMALEEKPFQSFDYEKIK